MTAAIWSTAPNACSLNFPALTLIRFMHNHHLLQISDRPNWLTIPQGSKIYIESVMQDIPDERVHLNTPVTRVVRRGDKVVVTSLRGEEEFDHVILATHADTSLGMLGDATALERDVLGDFEFSRNVAALHTDLDVPPFDGLLLIVVDAKETRSLDVVELHHQVIDFKVFV
jgi:predicted NAD/FAD-binding protein